MEKKEIRIIVMQLKELFFISPSKKIKDIFLLNHLPLFYILLF